MTSKILLQQLAQSKNDCLRILNNINSENINFRLTEKTASVGFIYRHIGETTNLIAQFFGYQTAIEGTTVGQIDTGKKYDLIKSHELFQKGYHVLEIFITKTSDSEWLEEIETSWFGKSSRIQIYTILLLHNAQHCGQIASAIAKGKEFKIQ